MIPKIFMESDLFTIMLKTKIKNYFAYLLLGIILLTHILIFTRLIYFPYPELFIYPYLTNHGLVPYSQILDQHFPGLMFLPINLNNLGMTTPDIARIWSIVIVLTTHVMLFFISNRIFKSKTKALLVNILYLIWQPFFEGWVLWIDSFLPLLLLPAFYTLYKKNFFVTGILLGMGIVFKQTIIPLSIFVLIYLILTKNSIKTIMSYLSGLFIPVGLMIAYFFGIGVLRDFWYWTVTFNLTTYAKFGRGAGPTLAHLTRVLVVFGSSFLIITKIKFREAQILLMFLVGALMGLSTRFDFVHFQPALPFALIAFVYSFLMLKKLFAWGATLIYCLVLIWWQVIFYKGHIGDRIISFDSNTLELAAKIRNYTHQGEKIFVLGAAPQLYQMTNTLPAGDIFVFQFPWFLQVAGVRILDGIKTDKPKIVVSNRKAAVENHRITDFVLDINQYILDNYEKIDNVGDTEILRKK